jgi:hypothetical protein
MLRNPMVDLRPFAVNDADPTFGETAYNAVVSRFPATEAERARRVSDALDVLARNGLKTGKLLGTGTAAHVYALKDYPEWVVKVTFDPTDAVVMAEMENVALDAGIPDVSKVYDLGKGLYAILLERLTPLSAKNRDRIGKISMARRFGQIHDEAAWKYLKSKHASSPEFAFATAVKVLDTVGFRSHDLTPAHMMQREDGSVVVSDFGYMSVNLKKRKVSRDIGTLKNPSHKATPSMSHPFRRNPLPSHLRPTRRNPVIDLTGMEDQQDLDQLRETLFDLTPGGPDADSDSPARERRDEWAREVLAEHGIETAPIDVGRGVFATVYPLRANSYYVVKITSDPLDAAAMAEAQFAGTLSGTSGIPKVAGVFWLGKMPKSRDPRGEVPGFVWAIVVEKLDKLAQSERDEINVLVRKYERGWKLNTPQKVKTALKSVTPGSPAEAWLNGVAFLLQQGFRPADLHASNVMRKTEGYGLNGRTRYAVTDFGLSFPRAGKRTASRNIPTLAEEPLRLEGFERAKAALAAQRAAASKVRKAEADALYAELKAGGFESSSYTRNPTRRRNPGRC